MTSLVKKAVLVGINYEGTNSELAGCINDSENMKSFLIKNKHFVESDFTLINDHTEIKPTKANIMAQFEAMVQFAKDNSHKEVNLFFAYSGHGYHIKDTDGDESDGQDEVLCPIDYDTNGFIIDDDIKSKFIDRLGSNVKLMMLIDACHSGTVCDLKYNYLVGKKRERIVRKKTKETKCECVMLSGCMDKQTSADAYMLDREENKHENQGACTCALINCYYKGITVNNLITNMRYFLKTYKFTQVPQVSSGRFMNVNRPLLLCEF